MKNYTLLYVKMSYLMMKQIHPATIPLLRAPPVQYRTQAYRAALVPCYYQ